MKTLALKINGHSNFSTTVVTVDGKPIKFKKNSFGNLTGKYQTAQDKVKIKIYNVLDVGGIFWFITQLFFFLISIFGIFDLHCREKCVVLDFEMDVDLQDDNQLTLQINPPRLDGKAINVETNLVCQELVNQYQCDEQAKRTMKNLRWAKIICAVAVVAVVTLVVVNKIIGG